MTVYAKKPKPPWFETGDRVVVTKGEFTGKPGVVVSAAPGPSIVYVRLDYSVDNVEEIGARCLDLRDPVSALGDIVR